MTRIARVRGDSVQVALGLDFACIFFSVVAAFVTLRALRRQQGAELAYEKVLEMRADELEIFAKRVAHDLLSPLSAPLAHAFHGEAKRRARPLDPGAASPLEWLTRLARRVLGRRGSRFARLGGVAVHRPARQRA